MNIRREVIKAVQKLDLDMIDQAYAQDASATLRALQMQVYARQEEVGRWHAISAIAYLAKQHAAEEDEVYRNIIRRFIWQMCEESANVPWASPEVIAAVMMDTSKVQYQEFLGPLFYHAGLNEICFAGLFWAIGQLAMPYHEELKEFIGQAIPLLTLPDLDVRAYGAWAMQRYPREEARVHLEDMLDDDRVFPIYEQNVLSEKRVSDLAKEALQALDATLQTA